ncbi:MAG: helix-turn-helix transcriptional regulator [Paraclostridium sp.]
MPNKLLGLRKSIHKTQAELADLLNINQATFSKKEKGQSEFKKTEMEKITIFLRQYYPSITTEEIFFS